MNCSSYFFPAHIVGQLKYNRKRIVVVSTKLDFIDNYSAGMGRKQMKLKQGH